MDMNSAEFWQTELGKFYLRKLKKTKKDISLDDQLLKLWENFSEASVGVVSRSDRPEKKFKVLLRDGRTVHFGARGYVIGAKQDEKRGENFCSRSASQVSSNTVTPAFLSQMTWSCNKGKLDKSLPTLKLGDNIYNTRFQKYFDIYGVRRE